MASDLSSKIKISVWRDVKFGTSLLLGETQYLPRGTANLHQEVYSWQTKEDHFGGVGDEAIRSSLQEKLIAQFDASMSPSQRNCSALLPFINEAMAIVEAGKTEWIASADSPSDDDDIPYMLNPLLALLQQLTWIHDMFAHQPGVSILIR